MVMKRLLLVEDHAAFRDSLALLLEREPDLEVIGRVGSVAECREFLSGGGEFDVAVVDLYLPDGDGVELIGQLRNANPHATVLVLTISLDPEDYARAGQAGAEQVISKDTPLEWLMSAIRRLP
jgi:DNA-binding NarL/FixJ family response regulator